MSIIQDRFLVTLLLAVAFVLAPIGFCDKDGCVVAARPVPQQDAAEAENDQSDALSCERVTANTLSPCCFQR